MIWQGFLLWRLRRVLRRAFLLSDEEAREYVDRIIEGEATKWEGM